MTGPFLVIEASTYRGSAALVSDGLVLSEREVAMRGANGEWLMPAVSEALTDAGVAPSALAGVVCGAGPGSFTSLRIGAAIAKGIAFAHDLPLHSLSSLMLVATGGAALEPGGYMVVADALRGEWFAAAIQATANGGASMDAEPVRIARDAAIEMAAARGLTLIGPVVDGEGSRWPHACGAAPLLGALLAAGPVDLDSWEPSYGRLAEAQVKWEGAHGRKLPTG